MGIKRHGVKVLLKHDGFLVEKVMTKPQFESFIKSSMLETTDPWILIGNKPCMIDKYGNEIVQPSIIESYHGFEKEKSDPNFHDDYFMTSNDLMDVIKAHQTIDAPKSTSVPKKRLQFAAPNNLDAKTSG